MAGPGRYYTGDPYKGSLYTPPVDFISKALEGAQQTYDTNFLTAETLKNKYVETLAQDRARANEIQKSFEDKINTTVSQYGFDSGAASRELVKLKGEMEKIYGAGGEAGAMTSNLANVTDSIKRERVRLAKGEITQEQLNALEASYTK